MRIPKDKKKPPQKTTPSTISDRSHFEHNSEVNAMLDAQRTIGNQNVLRSLRAHTAPAIQRDTSSGSPYRQRVIASKSYKLYLRDITHFHPDARFLSTVRNKWLRILNAYCAGYLKDTKYITRSDMKYDVVYDFDTTIKNMLEITWQNGDNPAILAGKLNRLDDELNASKEFMKEITKPSGFTGKSWVRDFHKKRHNDATTFMGAGNWTHAFSWIKWLGF